MNSCHALPYPAPTRARFSQGIGPSRRWSQHLMKTALSLVAGLPLLLPFLGGGSHPLTGPQVAHSLQAQMNGSSAGLITKRVECGRVASVEPNGSLRYACSLVGKNGSRSHVVVHVTGQTWRADWAPLRG